MAHLISPWASPPVTNLVRPRLPRSSALLSTPLTHSLPLRSYHSHHRSHIYQLYHRPSPSQHHPLQQPLRNHPAPQLKPTTTIRTMSSDDAYMSFLNKANADLDAGRNQNTQSDVSIARTETIDVDVQIPPPLQSVEAWYVSETDEPFEPVVLKWEGAKRGIWPGASQLSNLISPTTDLSSSIETLSPATFDPKNQYAAALKAVRAAAALSGGDEAGVDVKVYRVEVGTSRVEYFVLGLDVEGGKIVGLRAKSVES